MCFGCKIFANRAVAKNLSSYAEQFLISSILLFLLPFYLESMTLGSRNMIFVSILVIITACASWYSVYEKYVFGKPLVASAFYAFTVFSLFNFVFPVIVGINNYTSLAVSGAAAGLTVVLFLYPSIPAVKNTKNTIKAVCVTAAALVFSLVWKKFYSACTAQACPCDSMLCGRKSSARQSIQRVAV